MRSLLSAIEPSASAKCVLICQNRTCLKQGAAAVLAAFQAESLPEFTVVGTGCMGQCGSGPMVQIVPDQIWYSRVRSDEVSAVIDRHLLGNHPIKAMMYPKFHPYVKWP